MIDPDAYPDDLDPEELDTRFLLLDAPPELEFGRRWCAVGGAGPPAKPRTKRFDGG